MNAEEPRPLDRWIDRLSRDKMPAFAATAKAVGAISRDYETSFARLSKLVLQDPGLTTSILRRANSVWHSRGNGKINTVSRAVVVLGLQNVGSLCLSHALVDSIGDGPQRKLVDSEMAVSFHAAAQARGIGEKVRDRAPEELFIAALLHRLGPIAMWSFGDEEIGRMRALIGQGLSASDAELQALGFRLDELTATLTREWKLSPLLEESLTGKEDFRVQTLQLGEDLARSALAGWESDRMQAVLDAVAKHTRLPLEKVRELVEANAEEAVRTTRFLGAEGAARLIPLKDGEPLPDEADTQPLMQESEDVPNRAAHLELLSELTALIASGEGDLNQILGLALEGIYRGVGMRRVAFAMFTPDRRRLVVRYAIGIGLPPVGATFADVSPAAPNIFTFCLAKRRDLWADDDLRRELAPLFTRDIRHLTEDGSFFVMPAVVNGKAIGLFYADRRKGSPLDEESFRLFTQFGQQVDMGLRLISLNSR